MKKLIVSPDTPILEAVEILNKLHKRIILIAKDDGVLLGVVTDSEIRHAVLDKVVLQRPVSEIMVRAPITVGPKIPAQQVLTVMERTHCYQVPVIDQRRKIVGIHFIDSVLRSSQDAPETHRSAVIMAGGLGTRLMPLTENTPKPLLKIGDKSILFIILEQLIAANFDSIYITLNYKGEVIREAINDAPQFKDFIRFIEEDQQLGTAGALSLLPERPDSPFLVINGDVLTTMAVEEMFRFHAYDHNITTVALKQEEYTIPYGVAEIEGTRIIRINEKPTKTFFTNAGVYVVDPVVLDRIPKNTKWDMTDVVDDLLSARLRVGCFPIHEYWLDVGQHENLKQAKNDYTKHFNKDE